MSLSYVSVLRVPRAARPFAATLVGRLSYGIVPLALLLAVKNAAGSYAVAGGVMALFGALSVVLSPARAALIDRYGAPRALPPMAGVYAGLLVVVALLTWRPGAPVALVGALTVAAGACTPPLGPVMRAVWSALVPDRALLQRAYSLDGVAEELMYITAPLLVGVLLTVSGPSAGVLVGAVLVFSGATVLATSPAVPRGSRARAAGGKGSAAPRLRLRGIAPLRHAVLVTGAVGLGLGSLELLVVAFTESLHSASSVSWVLAALSAGSAVGGLSYGAVRWRSPDRVRLPLVAAALGATLLAAGFSPGLPVLAVLIAVAGLFVAPALTTAYLIADASVDEGRRTRAGAWVNTAFNAGSAAGSAAAGLLIDRLPLAVCFALAAAPALLCAPLMLRAGVRGSRQAGAPDTGARTDAVSGA
ncbi:MFS transporter [Streptomyces sp. NPDC057682]|uniref:MFS transporter n=1 Tax=Streptomyces sp. NPDC057682 TaxID=3346210 RepID=UPI00367ABAB5